MLHTDGPCVPPHWLLAVYVITQRSCPVTGPELWWFTPRLRSGRVYIAGANWKKSVGRSGCNNMSISCRHSPPSEFRARRNTTNIKRATREWGTCCLCDAPCTASLTSAKSNQSIRIHCWLPWCKKKEHKKVTFFLQVGCIVTQVFWLICTYEVLLSLSSHLHFVCMFRWKVHHSKAPPPLLPP